MNRGEKLLDSHMHAILKCREKFLSDFCYSAHSSVCPGAAAHTM